MLDGIRTKAQSWGVKMIFGIIIIVFVFWGVSNTGGIRAGSLAVVNGESISLRDFEKILRQAAQAEQRRTPELLADEEKFESFKGMILDSMITSQLLRQEAARLGIVVTPHELKSLIASLPVFHDDSGKFDPERYKLFLNANQTSPGVFEADMQNSLLDEKVMRYVSLSGGISEAEAKALYAFTLEKRVAEYALFSREEYESAVTVSEDEIAGYYEANKDRFRLPERFSLEFIRLAPEALSASYPVTDAEAEDFYQKNTGRFHQPDSFSSRHIFLAAPPDGSSEPGAEEAIAKTRAKLAEVEAKLAKGENFDDLAREYSEDSETAGIGGMLGWIERGRSGSPEFDEAALVLTPGQVSKPVRTAYGFHIIKLEEKKSASTSPFAEVKQEITDLLAREKADEDFENIRKAAEDGLNMNTPFAELAEKFHVQVEESGLVSRDTLEAGLDLHSDARQILLDSLSAALSSGAPATIPIPLNITDGLVLIRIKESKPSELPPLDDVRASILSTLRSGKAGDAARAAAEKAQELFVGPGIPDSFKGKIAQSKDVHRVFSVVEPLGDSQELVDALFSAPVGVWLPNVYDTPKGPVIVRLASVRPVAEEEWNQYKGIFIAQYKQKQEQDALESFVEKLRSDAKIEISRELLSSLRAQR
jgi:peptidyl-prolyl cis-trans isomerase D